MKHVRKPATNTKTYLKTYNATVVVV